MNATQRFNLVKRNTEEIVKESELKTLLKEKPNPSAYIGMACTGKIHLGYFVPIIKIKDFLAAGFTFKMLLADIHAYLDDQKSPFELLDKRVAYYKEIIQAMLMAVNADTKNLDYVRGSDFELKPEYTKDLLKLSAVNTITRCKRAASEVVRFGEEPKLSGCIYPIMQALDEQYLNVDCQYGGIDQRKILMFARENLPKAGYKPRIEIMTPMLPGLTGEKMSASVESSKIDILAPEAELKKGVDKAYCPEGQIENNGVLAFFKHVVMILKQDKKEKLTIQRPEKWGGNLDFKSYEELEAAFVNKELHPMDLKTALTQEVQCLIQPIRKHMSKKQEIITEAFPA